RFAEADRVAQLFQMGLLRRDFARLAAEIAQQAGATERALDLARQAVPNDDKDYRDWLWLGALRTSAGRKIEAERAFRRATVAAPGVDEGTVKAALALLDGNRRLVGDTAADRRARSFVEAARTATRSAAIKALEESARKDPLRPEELVRLARLCELGDDWPRA